LGLFSNRTLRLIFAISFLSGGIYSAVTAALEFIWVGRGFTPADAGLASGLGIFGSIAGGFLLPWLQTRLHSAKLTLVLSQSVTLLLCYPLLQASSPSSGTFIAVVLGVFWLGSTPVFLTLLEGAAGRAQAGAASSMFWALNAIGSMGFVWAFSEIMELASWRVAAMFSLVLLAAALAAVFALPARPKVSLGESSRGRRRVAAFGCRCLALMDSLGIMGGSPVRGGAVWQLVGLITRRSQVQILPPLPIKSNALIHRATFGFFARSSRRCLSISAHSWP
jgi:MFS family permease